MEGWALLCPVASSNTQPREEAFLPRLENLSSHPQGRGEGWNPGFSGLLSRCMGCGVRVFRLTPTLFLWALYFRPGGHLQ